MIQRGLTIEHLAAACGVKRVTMSDQIARNFPSRRLRLVAESLLNQPIWSNQADFEARQHLAQRCGLDPFAATVPKLRQLVTVLKLRGRSRHKRKAALIALLQAHFANAKTDTQQNAPPK